MRHRISSIEAGCATLRVCERSSPKSDCTQHLKIFQAICFANDLLRKFNFDFGEAALCLNAFLGDRPRFANALQIRSSLSGLGRLEDCNGFGDAVRWLRSSMSGIDPAFAIVQRSEQLEIAVLLGRMFRLFSTESSWAAASESNCPRHLLSCL